MLLKRILSLVVICVVVAGCSSDSKYDSYKDLTAERIYTKAAKNIDVGNYVLATQDLEALEARYPYGEYSEKGQIALIYLYYKQKEAPQAEAAIERFIHTHPKYPDIDYVLYIKGLVHFEENFGLLFQYLPLDKYKREKSESYKAFLSFKNLIVHYPNSKYSEDARKRLIYLKNQMALHELHVAKYYLKKEAYVAAINRLNYILTDLDGSTATPKALSLLHHSYKTMGMQTQADSALKTLNYNFPGVS